MSSLKRLSSLQNVSAHLRHNKSILINFLYNRDFADIQAKIFPVNFFTLAQVK